MLHIEVALTFGLSIFLCIFVQAQHVSKPASIVTSSGETLQGEVRYRNWEKNPSSIQFTDRSTDATTSLTVADIELLVVDSMEVYKKAIIVKDTRPVDLQKLIDKSDEHTVSDTVLLRKLLETTGFSVYAYTDFKPHFYIEQNGKYIELEYQIIRRGNSSQVFYNNRYRDQIKALMVSSEPGIERSLQRLQYVEKDITTSLKRVAEHNKNTITYSVPSANNKLTSLFFLGLGGGVGKIRFSGNYDNYYNMHFATSFLPYLSAGIDISNRRNLQDITFRGELFVSAVKYYGEKHTVRPGVDIHHEYTVSQLNISPSLSLLYNFVRTEGHRAYAGAGASFNFSSYSNEAYTLAVDGVQSATGLQVEFSNPWITVDAKAGYRLNNKVELGINWPFTGAFTNYLLWSMRADVKSVHFRYFF